MALTTRQIDHVKQVLGINATGPPDAQFHMGQWTTLVWDGKAQARINMRNDTLVFSAYVARNGVNYDAYLEVKEPELAIAVPTGVSYLDASVKPATPDQKIAGIICQSGPRFSFSNPNAPSVTLDDDGTLTIDGDVWHLHTLLMPDKNRVRNYNAYFGKKRPMYVQVLELGDLELFRS